MFRLPVLVCTAALCLVVVATWLGNIQYAQAVSAATISVNTFFDPVSPGPGVCSFRSALQAANTNQAVAGCAAGSAAGSDLIVLPMGTFTLTQLVEQEITSTVTISGAGDGRTIFTSPNAIRWLLVSGAARVGIQGVTVQGFNYSTAGSGIWVESTSSSVTVTDSSFIGNNASPGTIWNAGTVVLNRVTIKGNHSDGAGGGAIYTASTGRVTLQNSTLSDNSAAIDGGGLLSNGVVTITNSTISGNSSGGVGGGIAVYSGTVKVQNSTIYANHADVGLFENPPTGAGGVDVASGAVFAFYQTIIAGNYYNQGNAFFGPDECHGTLTSQHYNWIGVPNCIVNAVSPPDKTGDPKLGPLSNNGGPTWTHNPGSDSGVIDAGDPGCLVTSDQRGVSRPIDGNRNGTATCDMGAVEYLPQLFLPLVRR